MQHPTYRNLDNDSTARGLRTLALSWAITWKCMPLLYTVRHKLSITCLIFGPISQPLNDSLFPLHSEKINVSSTDSFNK